MDLQLPDLSRDQGELWMDGRALHTSLKVNTKFSVWIQRRLDECAAREGKDFFPSLGKSAGGRPMQEYRLTLRIAKEIAMLERTPIGKAVRLRFIEIEEEFTAGLPPALPAPAPAAPAAFALPDFTNPILAARAWADAVEQAQMSEAKAEEARHQLNLAGPKVDIYDQLVSANSAMLIDEAAKILGWGEQRLRDQLHLDGVLMHRRKCGQQRHNLPYQEHIDAGRFEVKVKPYTDPNGITHNSRITYVTPLGLVWLKERYPKPNQQRLLLAHGE